MNKVKVLFLSDTHLGFDDPIAPKINIRRRGKDFWNNYKLALQSAFDNNVDFIIHGGDMFFRSKVHQSIVTKAYEPLLKLADEGMLIFIVPGNHERSFLPVSLFETHKNIKNFDSAITYPLSINGMRIALSGFACVRNGIRDCFNELVKKTKYFEVESDFKFLCLHQSVEGATVGVQNYTFREGADIIRGRDIPPEFDALLSGHIHRHQILTNDLRGNKLSAPVVYPGSIERTSFAEMNEVKGYFIIELTFDDKTGRKEIKYNFVELPTRRMVKIEIDTDKLSNNEIETFVTNEVSKILEGDVVSIRIKGERIVPLPLLKTEILRGMLPKSVSLSITYPRRNFT